MRSPARFVAAAILLAAAGAVALAAGLLERRVARAEEMLMSLDFDATAAAYDELASDVGYARYIPWAAGDALDRVRARRAAARYWDGEYDALAAIARDAGSERSADLLFIAANSIYRLAQSRTTDDARLLQALDDARGAYVEVMRGSAGHPDAAFNYEYLGLVRNEIAKVRGHAAPGSRSGVNPPGDSGAQSVHGREGAPPPGRPDDEFKIYVPSETEERKGLEPGGDQLRRRKG